MIFEIYNKKIAEIQDKIFSYNSVKLEPTEWISKNVYLSKEVTQYPGMYNYDLTPYVREVVENLSPSSDVEKTSVMKNNQSGFTMGVIIPFICYTIKESPANVMFLSGTDELMQKTVRTKLDPVILSSGIDTLIKSQDTRRRNSRTGNTDSEKQFAGGSIFLGSYKVNNLRMASAKIILADEFDVAPYSNKDEGNIRLLLENRTTSYPKTKKLCYLSTPTISGASNIEQVYLMGDQRHWNWNCPHCSKLIDILWSVDREDGTRGGIKFEIDEHGLHVEGSVYYECQHCKGKILEKEKNKLNKSGVWIPTAKPIRSKYRSYQVNSIYCFDSWDDLVSEFLLACPVNGPTDLELLKAFKTTKLAQPWEEIGISPRVNELLDNIRSYEIGQVPDVTCERDGNGKICLISMSCDLGGVMEINNEDVRIDWEIVAHSTTGVMYHINHGSIGTFKRGRKKTNREKENESERDMYTYAHGQKNSAWPILKNIIDDNLIGQSGDAYNVEITLIDTGFFTKLAYDFIKVVDDSFVIGIKGYNDEEYRRLTKDTPIISRSREFVGKLYLLQVNQLKDILSQNMKLKMGMDGYQPSGFMNFPQPSLGKYNMKSYFSHYEGEHRYEVKKGDMVVGYAWKKKNSGVENHFFDVAVYNIAAREIFIDLLRRSDSKNAKLDWESFATMMS